MRPLTHLYRANLMIDEIERTGKLIIPPVKGDYTDGPLTETYKDGDAIILPSQAEAAKNAPKPLVFPIRGRTFQVPPDAKKAITGNKEFFRAGAAGFRFIPDMIFSRTIVSRSDSGMWLEHMYKRMLLLPAGKDREQAYAFILGAMTHFAGEMFSSVYEYGYAPGWTSEAEERRTAVERYIDSKITKLVAKDDRKVSIPADLIVSCFADIAGVEGTLKVPGPGSSVITVVEWSEYESEGYKPFHVKDDGKDKADEENKDEDPEEEKEKESVPVEIPTEGSEERSKRYLSSYKDGTMLIRGLPMVRDLLLDLMVYDPKKEITRDEISNEKLGLIIRSAESMNKAVKEWAEAWGTSLQGILNDEGASSIKKSVAKWYNDNLKGITDTAELIGSLSEIDLSAKEEALGTLDRLKNMSAGEKEPFEKLFPDHYGPICKEYESGKDKLSDTEIEKLFDGKYDAAANLYKILDNDMHDLGKDPYPYGDEKKEFKMFSLGLTASKMFVMGAKNLDDYVHREEVKLSGEDTVSAVRKLKVKIKMKADDDTEPKISVPLKFDVCTPEDEKDVRVLVHRTVGVKEERPAEGEKKADDEKKDNGAEKKDEEKKEPENKETEEEKGTDGAETDGSEFVIEDIPDVEEIADLLIEDVPKTEDTADLVIEETAKIEEIPETEDVPKIEEIKEVDETSGPPEERTSEEEYAVVLPEPMLYEKIKEFKLSQYSVDGWTVESADITDADTNWVIASIKKFPLSGLTATLALDKDAVKFKKETMEVPHKMASWMYSLDGRDHTGNAPPRYRPWEYKEYAVYYDIFRSKHDVKKKDEGTDGGKAETAERTGGK